MPLVQQKSKRLDVAKSVQSTASLKCCMPVGPGQRGWACLGREPPVSYPGTAPLTGRLYGVASVIGGARLR